VITATIAELSRALRAKRLSSVELAQGLLARIAQHDPALNAFVTVDAERALAAAHAADATLARGGAGPLVGIPIATRTSGHAAAHDLQLADARELRRTVRRARRDGTAQRRHGARRQDEHGRVRDGLVNESSHFVR
jgi:hypothetical protein